MEFFVFRVVLGQRVMVGIENLITVIGLTMVCGKCTKSCSHGYNQKYTHKKFIFFSLIIKTVLELKSKCLVIAMYILIVRCNITYICYKYIF